MSEISLIGKKIGITREFYKTSQSVPVTIVKTEKARIIQLIDKLLPENKIEIEFKVNNYTGMFINIIINNYIISNNYFYLFFFSIYTMYRIGK